MISLDRCEYVTQAWLLQTVDFGGKATDHPGTNYTGEILRELVNSSNDISTMHALKIV